MKIREINKRIRIFGLLFIISMTTLGISLNAYINSILKLRESLIDNNISTSTFVMLLLLYNLIVFFAIYTKELVNIFRDTMKTTCIIFRQILTFICIYSLMFQITIELTTNNEVDIKFLLMLIFLNLVQLYVAYGSKSTAERLADLTKEKFLQEN